MNAARYRGLLAVWVLLIAYASLYPFGPPRLPSSEAVAGLFLKPRYIVAFDVGLNIVAYIPLGVVACLYFGGNAERMPPRALVRAVLFAAALSFAMESCQLFIPSRVASIYDVMANAGGALLGAWIFTDPIYSVVTRPLGAWRESALIPGVWGDAGVMLVVLWLIAQLNPALPFFGAGNIVEGREVDVGVLQWSAVALGICGFGLFVSALLRGEAGTLRVTAMLLTVALWLKFLGASFMLMPHFAEGWLSVGRVAGLIVGLAALVPLRRVPRAGRIYLAIVMVLAGALFSKIFGAYSGLDELLKVFRWPYGQLANFATLTRFLHELWPLAALTFLIALFLRTRRASVQ